MKVLLILADLVWSIKKLNIFWKNLTYGNCVSGRSSRRIRVRSVAGRISAICIPRWTGGEFPLFLLGGFESGLVPTARSEFPRNPCIARVVGPTVAPLFVHRNEGCRRDEWRPSCAFVSSASLPKTFRRRTTAGIPR